MDRSLFIAGGGGVGGWGGALKRKWVGVEKGGLKKIDLAKGWVK